VPGLRFANETGIHFLIHPGFVDGCRRQEHEEDCAIAQSLVDLLAETLARSDFPFCPPRVDPIRHERLSDPLGEVVVLPAKAQKDLRRACWHGLDEHAFLQIVGIHAFADEGQEPWRSFDANC